MTNAELFDFLFEDNADAQAILTGWVLQSRKFQTFLVENRAKVRKKLRLAGTGESLRCLLLELDVARRLVDDTRCRVEYEKQGQGRERYPDLTVTFRTNTLFNLEVTGVQMPPDSAEARTEKLIRVVCEKLGQVAPQMLNILVIAPEGCSLTENEVIFSMKSLKGRVERRESKLLSQAACKTPADFFKQFQWLNGIIIPASEAIVWINPQSRNPLPPEIHTLLKSRLSVRLLFDHVDAIKPHVEGKV